ncbi:MAG: tetratricopeptide repeat protein [Methanothrix sp.]|nr:tetratricopeptide repeat protein [Methanothrix sp.]
MDFRDAKGPVVNPSGNVEQQFGDRNYFFIPKPDETPRLPFIPEPPSDFTGRNEEQKELLAEYSAGKNIIGLRGIGGVGKTALALKLAESLKDRYPDGQIMVDMMGTTNPITPMEAMAYVIHSYHRNEKIPESDSEVKDRYLEVLNGKRVLLLLDNASDDKQVIKLIPPKSCALLITSRRTIKIPGLFKKDLDVMKPGEAVELLLNVCCPAKQDKSRRSDPAWPEIASLCGFLPLALRAAGSYLANSEDISPKQYAQELKDERTRLEMIGEQGVEMSVDASFGLSFQRLALAVQKTFLDLSVFPADFDAQAEEQICLDDKHRNLSELVRWSLVDYKSQDRDYGRYRVHDLSRLFASARQPDESREIIAARHSSYYKDLLAAADQFYLQGSEGIQKGLALFDREEVNINVGHAWSCKSLEVNSQAVNLCMNYPGAGVYVIDLRLHPTQRISWLEEALKAARKLRNRGMEGNALGNLGLAYADLGDARKAIEYFEQHLAIAREIGDRRGEGNALGNLGNAYAALGDARQAIEYYEQQLSITREIGDRRGEGNALGNLGLAYAALGDARKAIEYYDQALAILREIGDRRGEGALLGNLGLAYAALGDARKAIEYYDQALAIDREIGDRRGEGADLGNLGNAYADLGDARKAIEYYEQALAIAKEIGDKRNEGAWLGNLGIAYKNLGDALKAIEYHDQALAIAREIGDRRGEGADLGNLGLAYAALGDARQAIEYYKQRLVIAREIGDRRGEGNALFNSSLALYELGKHPDAIKNAEIALEIYRQIESPFAARVEQKLAEWRR